MKGRLEEDLSRLKGGLGPCDAATGRRLMIDVGQAVNSLVYTEEQKALTDEDVVRLAMSVGGSKQWGGEIILSSQGLSDVSGLALGEMLASNCRVWGLDLSDNCLTEKTAVEIAKALEAGSGLRRLSLARNHIGRVGVR